MKSQALAALLFLVLVLAPALSAELTPEQVTQLETVTTTALSPDGATVAFTVSVPRTPEEDTVPGLRAQTRLYVAPAAGGAPQAVVEPPLVASSPAWSPDGSRLGFLHRGQVHTVPASGGVPSQVTDAPMMPPMGLPLSTIRGSGRTFPLGPTGPS